MVKMIKVRYCHECPYFDIDESFNDDKHCGHLCMFCNRGNPKIIKDLGEYDLDNEIKAHTGLENIEIPKWCPLQEIYIN